MDIIDALTYASYRYNRDLAPHITAQEWVCVYGPTDEMESRYRDEILNKLADYYDHTYDGTWTPMWVDEYEEQLAKIAGIAHPQDAYAYAQQEIDKRIKERREEDDSAPIFGQTADEMLSWMPVKGEAVLNG